MGFTAVGYFLVALFFSLIIFCLWIRIALRYLKISALSPFAQLIYSVTNPVVFPVQKLLSSMIASNRYDWSCFIILVLVEFLKITLLSLIVFSVLLPLSYCLLYVLADLILQPCNILFYAILIRVIMSYINPLWRHPMADFIRILTDPLLRLGHKIVPDISGFDFSPFVIMIILKVITLFISASLPGHLL